ncbi:pentatricopeptide repeat-containing protein At4g02750-like [Selaginella moellendorffii]|uniref:pentatricopeptide repeat-containing protein At4g02750-like n=1 Tax=Selaginella moellendorffii TaxID=88036 RepID=UPI000D1C3F50|nr:pentatricopeptide repeat-containing protein At4g02750-like [Selaginella moellendorffii]|eukprot:XP_024522042.1 pentatricopeptide repeat-containing protein At4g02750-like [Selaginella moellendorffii]
MLAAYAQNGHIDMSRAFFDPMPRRSLVSWNTMLAAYVKSGDCGHASQIFNDVPMRDVVTWTTMLTGHAQSGYILAAERLFHEMPEWNLLTWSAIFSGYILKGDKTKSQNLLEKIPVLDLILATTILTTYAHSGHISQVVSLFDQLPSRDLVSWSALLSSYATNFDLDGAESVFDAMPERNLVCWNTILSANALAGQKEKAKTLFDSMPMRDTLSWTSLLNAYSSARNIEQAKSVYDQMPRHDLVSRTAMLAAFAANGHPGKAKAMFDSIPELQCEISWNALLASNAQNARFIEALEAFYSMATVQAPTATSFVPVIISCSHRGEIYRGRSLFLSMGVDHGLEYTRQHFCCMLDLLGRGGFLDASQELIVSMPFIPGALEYTCLLGACQASKNVAHGGHVVQKILGLEKLDASEVTTFCLALDGEYDRVSLLVKKDMFQAPELRALLTSAIKAARILTISERVLQVGERRAVFAEMHGGRESEKWAIDEAQAKVASGEGNQPDHGAPPAKPRGLDENEY